MFLGCILFPDWPYPTRSGSPVGKRDKEGVIRSPSTLCPGKSLLSPPVFCISLSAAPSILLDLAGLGGCACKCFNFYLSLFFPP